MTEEKARGDHELGSAPGRSQPGLAGEAVAATCARPAGLDSPETQLHPASTAGALIVAEGARGRQGQGVKGVTVCGIADADH